MQSEVTQHLSLFLLSSGFSLGLWVLFLNYYCIINLREVFDTIRPIENIPATVLGHPAFTKMDRPTGLHNHTILHTPQGDRKTLKCRRLGNYSSHWMTQKRNSSGSVMYGNKIHMKSHAKI